MTWLAHSCWYCGLKHKRVEFIVGDSVYQCAFEIRDECEARRAARIAAVADDYVISEIVRERLANDTGERLTLDEVLAALGYTRAEVEQAVSPGGGTKQ